MRDWKKASEIYMSCNEPMKAVQMIGDTKGVGWKEALTEIVRNLPKSEELALERCASKNAVVMQ
eukprot:12689260-Ditylum_brightwellii.AAC.1